MKSLRFAGISVIVVLALGVLGVGFVYAQQPTQTPWGSFGPGGMMGNGSNGNGMMGSYSQDGEGTGWMNGMHQWMTATGGMHTLVWSSLAETLDLTTDELNSELSSGKTLTQIAEERGISQDELSATLETAVQAGLEKAVAEGAMTQEQADAMLAHMSGNYAWMLAHIGAGTGYGSDGCHGSGVPQT